MSADTTAVAWLADTSFVMCFGASKGGRKHLWTAYGGAAGATPGVRYEIERNVTMNPGKAQGRSALQFSGRSSAVLKDVPFLKCDEQERDTALSHMRAGTLPETPAAVTDTSAAGQANADTTTVEHGGESESLAVAHRTSLGILMTDKHAVRYAKVRGIVVESFLDALIRLTGTISSRELFTMWKAANLHHYGGPGTVTGQHFFTVPAKSTSI